MIIDTIYNFLKDNMLDFTYGEFKYAISSIMTIPLSAVFLFVNGKKNRMLIDFILGMLILGMSNGEWVFLLLLMSTFSYFYNLIDIKPIDIGKKLKKIDIKTIIAVGLMTAISFSIQLLYMMTKDRPEGPAVEEYFFNTTMILTLKVGYLTRYRSSVNPFMKVKSKRTKKSGVRVLGSKEPIKYLEWLCYSVTLMGSLSGMALRIEHWEDWINEKWKKEKKDMKKASIKMGVKNVLIALMCLGFYSFTFKFFIHQVDTMKIFSYNEFSMKHNIRVHPLFINIVFLIFAMFSQRCMYYYVWQSYRAATCMSQAALEPMSEDEIKIKKIERQYNKVLRSESEQISNYDVSESFPVERNHPDLMLSFTRCENTPILKVENATTMAELTYYWNSIASSWWREYVYKPLVSRKVSPIIALFVCNELSAIWHGPTIGFHIFFLLCSWAILCAKFGWKYVRPAFVLPYRRALNDGKSSKVKIGILRIISRIYTAGMYIFTKVVVSTASPPFVYLTLNKSIQYLKRVCFLPLWLCPSAAIINIILSKTVPYIKKYKGLKE